MKVQMTEGGPLDGATMDIDERAETHEHAPDPWTTTADTPVRRFRKIYLYARDHQYRHRFIYVGEDVAYDDDEEEVKADGPS